MNRKSGVGAIFLLFVLLLSSCGREEVIDNHKEALFRKITPSASSVVLSLGGSATLGFRVDDPNFLFNYEVGKPDCQIGISLSGGSNAEYFVLSSVRKGEGPGFYIATFTDLGVEPVYSEDVTFTMRLHPGLPSESVIMSGAFRLSSDSASAGKTIVRTGLPIVYIDTNDGKPIVSKDVYKKARVSINGMGVQESLSEMDCEVRGRGNTTWTWPKKPYLIRLSEKQHVFGMHKHKRWVLLANFLDRTMMRNIVSMHVSTFTRLAWTPGCQPVEVVLNGKHIGNYLLIEQVRVDNHRVNISKDGYLLELDFHYDNKVQWYEHGIPFAVKHPDPDSISTSQKTYIKNYIKEVSDVIYGKDFKDPEKGYAKYLDVDSFVDYWLVYEVMGNHELGNPGSVFFHKEKDGKLVAGPCWDFDWGVLSYKTSPQARTGLVNGKAIWYGRLFEDPAFKAKVKARFQELLPRLQEIPEYIDSTETALKASADLNFAMWNPAEDASQNGGHTINGDENMSFHDAVVRLKEIYEERLTVIPKNL